MDDLRTALSLVPGLEAPPGGDAGPSSAILSLWGLHEFDAFLLVVDGVPWGGAFNPAISTLNLNDVERIEVLKAPRPSCMAQLLSLASSRLSHYPAGQAADEAELAIGNYGSPRGIAGASAAIGQQLPAIRGDRRRGAWLCRPAQIRAEHTCAVSRERFAWRRNIPRRCGCFDRSRQTAKSGGAKRRQPQFHYAAQRQFQSDGFRNRRKPLSPLARLFATGRAWCLEHHRLFCTFRYWRHSRVPEAGFDR